MDGPERSWGAATIGGAILGLTLAVGVGVSLITPQPSATNPAVFSAFRAIEAMCLKEEWPHETVRCKGALDERDSCDRAHQQTGYVCTAAEYYCRLERLGFDLPPYWKDGEKRRHPCLRWWE